MKKLISAILLMATVVTNAQSIYTRTFGDNKARPVIFLHGGPGYNSVNFEATTAQELADKGFFVVVYDRRGEGRSKDPNAQFNFTEAIDDLNNVYEKYGLTKSILIGHSFGGVVAALFAEANPKKVQSVILVSAPVSMQKSFKNILARSKIIYQSKKDSINLNYVSLLEAMDTSSMEYGSYCLAHALRNGFYSPKNPTDEAKAIHATFKTDTLLKKYASQMTYQAPIGFWKNEKYTTIDLTGTLEKLKKEKVKVFGLYGKDDGLYSAEQVMDLQKQIGVNNLKYFDNCSHNVFMDQRTHFISAVLNWIK